MDYVDHTSIIGKNEVNLSKEINLHLKRKRFYYATFALLINGFIITTAIVIV